MIFNKKVEQMYADMRDKLTADVYAKVGKMILEQSQFQQKAIQMQLDERLIDWERNIKKRVKEIVDEERNT